MIYRFATILKTTPWGGHRLRRIKGLPPADEAVGESWELSAVPGMESTVEGGPEAGMTIPQLIAKHGANLLGSRVAERYGSEFPILVKLIDASRWLSVQVHPSDSIARELEGPQAMGKSEMWHIIEATPDAELIAGFKPGVSAADYRKVEATAGLLDITCRHRAIEGSDYYIHAGTIHAIGPGCLIAEVQQSSDLTYRVYDYNRPRELHLDKARRALNFAGPELIETPMPEFFTVKRHAISAPAIVEPAPGSFTAVMVLKGHCMLDTTEAPAGSTLLISADHGPARLEPRGGDAVYLSVTL